MKNSATSIFTDGSTLLNPGPSRAGALILSTGMNKPPIKIATTFSSNSTNYHAEIHAIILALNYIFSAQSKYSVNTIHIFSDSICAINAITSFYPREIHHDKVQ